MNELFEYANEIMENFDPATDSVTNFEPVPAGEYSCMLDNVTTKCSTNGNDYICFDFYIIGDDYNRHIFVPYYLTVASVKRTIKMVNKLAYEWGYKLPLNVFETPETLANALNQLAGKQATVIKTPRKNSEYFNYEVAPDNYTELN